MFDTPSHPQAAGRLWLRRMAAFLAGLLLVWALLWLALPPLIQWQLQRQGSALLGRAVTVERVSVQPWALSLALDGLRVANAAGDAPQFSLDHLYIDVELQSLLRLAPVVDALRLQRPRLSVRHLGDGRLDLDDVIERLRPTDRSTQDAQAPTRFALFNIELLDGEVDFVDAAVGATHRLQGLQLTVPFLSNLGSRREVVTEPRLAFELNGSRFDSRASTTPFADHRQTRLRLQIPTLDVQPYLAYWPRALPWRPEAGRMHLDLTLDFEQRDRPALALSGELGLSGVRVHSGDGPSLAWDRLDVALRRAEPLRRQLEVARIDWRGPSLSLARDAQGRLRWPGAVAPSVDPPAAASGAEAAGPWQVQIDEIALSEGSLRWRDAAVRPAVDWRLEGLQARVRSVAWPMAAPAPFELDARLGEAALALRGSASDRTAQARLVLNDGPLALAAPYLSPYLAPALDGQLQADVAMEWRAPASDDAGALRLSLDSVRLDQLRLGPPRAPLARWRGLALSGGQIDLIGRRAEIALLEIQEPSLSLERLADGRWTAQDWWRSPAAPTPAAPAADTGPPWSLVLGDVRLQGGRLLLLDRLPAPAVSLALLGLNLRAQNLQPLAERPPEAALQLQLRVAQPGREGVAGDTGRVALDGRLQLPGRAIGPGWRGQLQIERLPLHALTPYMADRLNLELLRADASARGTLAWRQAEAGPLLELALDAALEDLRAHSLSPSDELLSWSSLQLRGLRLRSAPGEALSVQLAETVLSDYFARVLIDEQGRVNLQGLIKPAAGEAGAVETRTAPPPDVRIGPISLVNGRVRFSDRFVRPNYTANLSELTGSLSAFSSQPPAPGQSPTLAELSLKGRAEGTATLDISGRINPLATPLALDVRGQVRDLELPPLSPYSAKYAGYGIERGKLSVDVRYRVEPDGRLDASNQIVLNQLSFGERDSGSAANLPVKLAVALLADRDGVIDINLPVSGSLNDPQFRLGPIIVKLIFNLIGRAITAPFSLIASAFGGGASDASHIAFEPGRATLEESARRQLEDLARALQNRPALRLTLTGQADLQAERSGWQRSRLESLLQTEKRRRLARAGSDVPAVPRVEPAERAELLREVYRRADMPKPRNLVGLLKDIPLEEMEALLLAAQSPGEEAMRELAVARALAVKNVLLAQQVPEDRLFLGAPRTGGGAEAVQPRVELQVGTR